MKTLPPVKILPQAFAIVKAPKRRGLVRVARVEVVKIYDGMHAAGVQEIRHDVPHFLPFSRLVQVARRAELPAKLRRAIAEERAACERQTDLFRPSGLVSEDFSPVSMGSPADNNTLADGTSEMLSV